MSVPYDDVVQWVRAFAVVIAENKDYLTELDSAIGDADHGINMDRGMRAVLAKLDDTPGGDVGTLFKAIGMTLVSTVGGASGPLYGTLYLQLASATVGKNDLTGEDWLAALTVAGRASAELKRMASMVRPPVSRRSLRCFSPTMR